MNTKICSKCKRELPRNSDHFHKNRRHKDGLEYICKECRGFHFTFTAEKEGHRVCKKCQREFPCTPEFFKLKVSIKEGSRLMHVCRECQGLKFIKHPPMARDGYKFCSKCGDEKPETTQFFSKRGNDKFTSICKECDQQRGRNYYNNHTTEVCQRTHDYRIQHQEDNRPKVNAWMRNKRSENVNQRIIDALRVRIKDALMGKNKSASTLELLGCSIEFLRHHIEINFQEGMDWNNYGRGKYQWSLDHRKVCASFSDLSDPAQQRECFHWSNIFPMWHAENCSKGSLYNGVRHRYKK